MNEREDWEENTYAGLEGLDDDGEGRVAELGRIDDADDEPAVMSKGMPDFEEMDALEDGGRLA